MAFVTDAFSWRIVGWQASRSLKTDLSPVEFELAFENTDELAA